MDFSEAATGGVLWKKFAILKTILLKTDSNTDDLL